MGVEVSVLVNSENLRTNSDIAKNTRARPVVLLAVFLPVGIQASTLGPPCGLLYDPHGLPAAGR